VRHACARHNPACRLQDVGELAFLVLRRAIRYHLHGVIVYSQNARIDQMSHRYGKRISECV
jgi:hypothetical protein